MKASAVSAKSLSSVSASTAELEGALDTLDLRDLRVNPDWAKLPLFDRKGWKRVRFGDVVRCLKEQVDPNSGEVERYVAGEHMDSENVHIRRWGTVGDGYLGPAFIRRFRKGQVLYGSRRTYLKKVAVAEWDGVTANTTLVLDADQNTLLQRLLPWLMLCERFTKHSIQESKGLTNPYINWPDIAKFEFDLPPLDQQWRIAEMLWTIDSASQRSRALLQDVSQVRQVQLDESIAWPEHSPSSQSFIRLGNICTMQNGCPFPSADYQAPDEPGVRLIRPGNMAPIGALAWAASSTVTLPIRYKTEKQEWLVGPGEVLINLTAQSLEDGFMGRVCLTADGESALLNQRIGRFAIDTQFLPKFFFRCLQTTRFRALVESRCEGSKVRHLYFRHFQDFPLPLLEKSQQESIVRRLDAIEQNIRTTIHSMEDACTMLHSFSNRLFS